MCIVCCLNVSSFNGVAVEPRRGLLSLETVWINRQQFIAQLDLYVNPEFNLLQFSEIYTVIDAKHI